MLVHSGLWETCTLYRKTGVNGNGQPTYTTGAPVICSITRKTRTLRRQDGTDIQSTAQVTLPAEIEAAPQDKILLPEGTVLIVQDLGRVMGQYGKISHSVAFL